MMNNLSPTPPYKLIFKGRLEFGSQRTYDMVVKHWQTRLETYFKSDILFKSEVILSEEDFSLTIPQPHHVVMATEKAWRGTTDMLREVVMFAVVGKIQIWCIRDGHVNYTCLEPSSDKVATAEYQRGVALLQQEGMEEASEALSRAIERYQRHALAYERRGYINYKLGNYKDALYDFQKSADINPSNPEPFYGAAKVKMLKNEWESAIIDFDHCIKRSIALQPVYWLARLKKGECHVHSKQYAEAIKELQLYLKRNFGEEDPNFRRRRRAWYLLGKALLGAGDIKASLEAFNTALGIREGVELLPEAEALLHRGIARKQSGNPDYTSDFTAAAKLGNLEAVRLLEEEAR